MNSSFVQMSIAVVAGLVAAGCAQTPFFVPADNPEPVHVQVRDTPADVELTPVDAIHLHRHEPNTIEGPVFCTTSPCDVDIPGGTLLRAGNGFLKTRAFQLPERGAVRIVVDPGSAAGLGFGSLAALGGTVGTFVGGGLLGAGIVDGCHCAHYGSGEGQIIAGSLTLGASLALAAVGIWVFQRSRAKVTVDTIPTVEPVIHF